MFINKFVYLGKIWIGGYGFVLEKNYLKYIIEFAVVVMVNYSLLDFL